MTIHIKNMVCDRCKKAVSQIFEQMGIKPIEIQLGQVTVQKDLTTQELQELQIHLQKTGFSLIQNSKEQLATQIKSLLIDLVNKENAFLNENLSHYLNKHLNQDYAYLSGVFSSVEQHTIEQFFIHLKIERVKELLLFQELNLKEIAYLLNYSSLAHLSKQFKKVTGLTPTEFKNIQKNQRIPIDKI
ncbi:AraC family transcriptional regulator [Myroides sp. LJL119]